MKGNLIVKSLTTFLIVLFIILLVMAISTGIFIGLGSLVSSLFPLTLFQSALLIMGAVFVLGFSILVFFISSHYAELNEMNYYGDDYDDDYDDDDEYDDFDDDYDEEDEVINPLKQQLPFTKDKKNGRNQP